MGVVIKTHSPEVVEQVYKLNHRLGRIAVKNKRVWYFAAAGMSNITDPAEDWQTTAKHLSERMNVYVRYAQVPSRPSVPGYFILEDYVKVFGLSQDQADMLGEYMRHWQVLRQCC